MRSSDIRESAERNFTRVRASIRRVAEFSILLLFPALLLVSHYLLVSSFGLYEDDYSRIPRPMTMSLMELLHEIIGFFTEYVGQGRPLQLTFTFSQAYLGSKLAGLVGIYALGFCVLSVNSILFYFLLKRISNRDFAVIGGILFSIYSADTNQAYLTRSLGVFPSITFVLLAMHAYLSDRKLLAYLFSFFVLLTYETPYPILLTMPLLNLKQEWDKQWTKRSLINALVLGVILVLVFFARLRLGEGRVASMDLLDSIRTALAHMLVGPVVNLGLFFLRPIQALTQIDGLVVLVSIVSFFVLSVVLGNLDFKSSLLNSYEGRPGLFNKSNQHVKNRFEAAIRMGTTFVSKNSKIIILGAVMLILAYPLTLTVRPYAISGRATRVHFAAVIGSSILWGTVCYSLIHFMKGVNRSTLGALITAVPLSLTVGFGVVVQQDYARAWELQKIFWRSLSETIPYTEQSLTVFIDPQGLQDTRYIDANTWSLPRVYQYIYAFPDEGIQGPQIYRLIPDWKEHLQVNSVEIKAVDYRYQLVTSRWEDTIILETENNKISNRMKSIVIDDNEYSLSQSEFEAKSDFPHGILYSELLE